MTPPKDHTCEWRDAASALQERVAKLEATIAKLESARMRPHRSEKRPKVKLPPPVPPAPPAAAPRPNDDIRHAVLETEVEKLAVPEAKRTCPECSSTSLRAVGAGKTSTVYDYVGPHFRRRVCQRETLSCRCGEYIVTAAPPERVGEKVQFSASFVAHLVTTKCADNRAQYNLAKEYERLGIPISRSTINSLFHRAGKELAPLVERLFERIRDSVVVQADETSIKLQRATKRAFIWAFLGGGLIGYRFAEDRSGETPRTTLLASPGYIVVDAFTGYNKLLALGGRVRGGCLAHARRKIFEADEKSIALDLIGEIYALERRAKTSGITGTSAHAELRRMARPHFARLLIWAREARRTNGPKSLMGRAAGYIVNNFRELGLFLRTPLVPIDNNASEAALRRIALGRKNYLFVGNVEAGKRLAGLYSLVASCEANGKNPVAYLTDVLLRIGRPGQKIDELLPDRWTPS